MSPGPGTGVSPGWGESRFQAEKHEATSAAGSAASSRCLFSTKAHVSRCFYNKVMDFSHIFQTGSN